MGALARTVTRTLATRAVCPGCGGVLPAVCAEYVMPGLGLAPRCGPCWDVVGEPIVRGVFGDLPVRLARDLVYAGEILTRAHLATLTDHELGQVPGIGPWSLARIRAVVPGPQREGANGTAS